jgi:hypothetical protein
LSVARNLVPNQVLAGFAAYDNPRAPVGPLLRIALTRPDANTKTGVCVEIINASPSPIMAKRRLTNSSYAEPRSTQRPSSPLARCPVAAVYPIDKIKEALEHLHKGGKILLDFSQLQ